MSEKPADRAVSLDNLTRLPDPEIRSILPSLLQARAEYDQLRTAIKEMEEERDRVYQDFCALADSLPHKRVKGLYTRVEPAPRSTLSRAKLLEYVTVEVLEECTERKEVKAYYKIAPVRGSSEESEE